MPDRFSNVVNQIYRGGMPSDDDLRLMHNVYDIKTIISLDGNIGGQISPMVKELKMEHIIIPISGYGSLPLIEYLKNNIVSLLDSNQPVYVHCRHGSDRTGMAVAIYRMQKQGWSAEKALTEAKSFGFGDKLDEQTEKLYRSTIMENKDMSNADDDVTSAMRDQFQMGQNPPAYNPQQSFSAPDDYKQTGPSDGLMDPNPALKDPYAFVSSRPGSDREERVKKIRRVLLESMTGSMPQVGGRDGGSVPIGVGPTETGGMLNL